MTLKVNDERASVSRCVQARLISSVKGDWLNPWL